MTKVKVGGSKTCKVRKSICCRKVGRGTPPPLLLHVNNVPASDMYIS